jgi:hypothetical protein
MKWYGVTAFVLVSFAAASAAAADDGALKFSGREWTIRANGKGGPGPNHWDRKHAWVDAEGRLHLKLAPKDGEWRAAEVFTKERLGFGRYEFVIEGRVDKLDPNVVLGLFNYPPRDVGPGATHEIDIEFARWGNPKWPNGNFTVWPAEKGVKQTSKTFEFKLKSERSTHRFDWKPTSIEFESLDEDGGRVGHWKFEPKEPAKAVSRKPMPVHFNLWCFKGQPPTDAKPVEVVVRSFKFTPSD